MELHILTRGADLSVRDCLDRFTLIVGEVNQGKTFMSRRLLEEWVILGLGPVVVVDLAPSLKKANRQGKGNPEGIGGRLDPPDSPDVLYLNGPIHAPRLQSKSEEEAMALARENLKIADDLFARAQPLAGRGLFVNDASLYVQAGDPNRFLHRIRSARTAVVNAYYGRSLGSGALSLQERQSMDILMAGCDRLIHLSDSCSNGNPYGSHGPG